jgi:hypothetical protein
MNIFINNIMSKHPLVFQYSLQTINVNLNSFFFFFFFWFFETGFLCIALAVLELTL